MNFPVKLAVTFAGVAVLSAWLGCERAASIGARKQRKATITAEPNPIPAGPGAGKTRIVCDLGDEPVGEVYLSVNGGEEKRIFRVQNARDFGSVHPGLIYEFRLYRGTNHQEVLGSVAVTKK